MTIKAEVFALLDATPDLPAPEIARQLNCKERTVYDYRSQWRRGERIELRKERPTVAEVDHYPVMTVVGMCWGPPIEPPKRTKHKFGIALCDLCEKLADCRNYVRQGDCVGCERPLVGEVL